MTFYRSDDRWEDDSKLAGLSPSAFWAWHAMQAYCNRHLVDTIPASVPFARFSPWVKPAAIAKDLALLIALGVIEEMSDGGLKLVDFAEAQNLASRRAEREYDRERAREKRDREATARRPPVDHRSTSGKPAVDRRDSESQSQPQNSRFVRPDARSLETETEREAETEQARRPSSIQKNVDRPATTAREELATDRRRRAAAARRRLPDGDLAPLAFSDFGVVPPAVPTSTTTAADAPPDDSTPLDDEPDASCTPTNRRAR